MNVAARFLYMVILYMAVERKSFDAGAQRKRLEFTNGDSAKLVHQIFQKLLATRDWKLINITLQRMVRNII